ncbi:MAG: GGDEF domain-containing protein [Actinobacteria bacterium]|nr:GGDEF domain-containing protein [Actinomycetota bacterium]
MPHADRDPANRRSREDDARPSPETPKQRQSVFARFITPRGGENVDALGVPVRFHYRLLAMFAVGVALMPLVFSVEPNADELRNPLTRSLCLGGLIFAPVILAVGKRTGYVFKDWIFQGALFFALAGTFLSNLVTPHAIAPYMPLYILAPVGAAFYLPARKMFPLAIASAAAIMYTSSIVDEPNAMLRGMVLVIVAVCGAGLAAGLKAQLTRAIEHNREISERDALTGAHNVRRFEWRLADEIARARRGGEGFALVMFDLDNFKQVNDSFSHSVGDEVLIATAEAVYSTLLPPDLLVRRGGDEFAAILPVAPGRDVQDTVELACKRIERARRQICPELTPFASAGWVNHEPFENAERLIERTDAALHEAKANAPERRGYVSPAVRAGATEASSERGNVVDLRRLPGESAELRDNPIRGLIAVCMRTSAVVIAATSLVVSAMMLAGKTSFEISAAGVAVLAGWTLVMAPASVWLARRHRRPKWAKHVLFAAVFALIAAGCAVIGDAAPTLIDLFIFACLLTVALLPFQQAIYYISVGVVLYGVFLYSSDFPFAEIRLTVATMIVFLASIVLTVTRHHTILAAREKAQLARTDALTSLPNTRRLRDRLNDEIQRCAVTGDDLALLMLDLDDFKSVNDHYSHSLGDKVLVAVADAIREVCRHADMPARRGGDEFALVMTDAGANEATVAGNRIADAIRAVREKMVPEINPNASIGWAVWHEGESVDDLIAQADVALHERKVESHRVRPRYADAG